MNREFWGVCGAAALAFAACSESGTEAWVDNSGLAIGTSSSSVEESSSSDFGLSSSAPVPESSSSLAESSSSQAELSGSSAELSSSSETCVMKNWEQLGGSYPYVNYAQFCESSWPEGAIADGVWRVMETDFDISSAYSSEYGVCCGNSSVVWSAGVSENGEVPDSTLLEYGAPHGTAVLDKGSLTYNPFVSVGFTFAKDSSGKPVPVDVSDWGGICISYYSEVAPALELDLGDSVNAVLSYANPAASLPKSLVGTMKCIEWEKFKIPSWFKGEADGWRENTGIRASKQLVGIKFKMQAESGPYNFVIYGLDSYDRSYFSVYSGAILYAL